MSTYRKEWECCGDVSETQCYEPEECPFCRASPATPIAAVVGDLPPPESALEDLMHQHGLIGVAGDNPALEAKLIAFARAAVALNRAQQGEPIDTQTAIAHDVLMLIATTTTDPHAAQIAVGNAQQFLPPAAPSERAQKGQQDQAASFWAQRIAENAVEVAMEQQGEPVYQFSSLGEKNWSDCAKEFYDDCPQYNYMRRILYRAAIKEAAPADAPKVHP